jgi:hypothetical protein
MLITNMAGQRLGFIEGEFVQDIPNSYVQEYGEEEFYVIEGADQYTVEISGTGDGIFDFICASRLWNVTEILKYRGVPVNALTRAVLLPGSDLSLNVDADDDGTTDFFVFPVSIELSSPQPIKPLQVGTEMIYEIVLVNNGDPSIFLLEVDPPLNWSYVLSSNAVFLNPNESATILLSVTSPLDSPAEDYTIRMEVTS